MNIFISQPMNGKTEEEINDVRVEIISKLEKKLGVSYEDIYVVNAFDYGTEMPSRLVMLGRSIEAMAEADVIVFVEGFSAASGCLVEHEVAMSYINTDEFENKRVYFERRGNIVKARNRTDIYKGYEYDAHHNTRATDPLPKSEVEEDLKNELEGLRNDYDILAKDYEVLDNAHKGLRKEFDHVIEVRDARIRENKRLYNDLVNARSDFEDLCRRYNDGKESYNKLEHCNESLQNELIALREEYDNVASDYDRLKHIYESNVTAYTKTFEERNKYRDELYDLRKENEKLREKIKDYRIQANSVYGLCQPRGLYKGWIDIPYTRYDKMVIQADNGLYVSDIKYKDGEVEYGGFYTTDCKLSEVSYCVNIKDAKVYTDWPEAVCDRRQLNRMGARYKRACFSIKNLEANR